jgi:hypothetical protein
VTVVKFTGGNGEPEDAERTQNEEVRSCARRQSWTALLVRKLRVRGVAESPQERLVTSSPRTERRCFAREVWPCEGIGIEGSGVPKLLFEFRSNDHEFNIVIIVLFYQSSINV